MSEHVRRTVLVILLIAAVIWGYQNIFGGKTARQPAPRNESSTGRAETETTVARAQNRVVPDSIDALYDAEWGSDPFRWKAPPPKPGPGQKQAKADWVLSGIFFSDHGPIAVINDKLGRIGETVDNAEIVDINKKQVTLRVGGKERILTIPNG